MATTNNESSNTEAMQKFMMDKARTVDTGGAEVVNVLTESNLVKAGTAVYNADVGLTALEDLLGPNGCASACDGELMLRCVFQAKTNVHSVSFGATWEKPTHLKAWGAGAHIEDLSDALDSKGHVEVELKFDDDGCTTVPLPGVKFQRCDELTLLFTHKDQEDWITVKNVVAMGRRAPTHDSSYR